VADKRHPAVSVVVSYLSPLLDVPVSNLVPADRPDSFVRVWRVGGPKINEVTDGPMITCECWHPVSAEDLANQVLQLLDDMGSQFIEYPDDFGNTHRAWVIDYFEEVGAPTQMEDEDVPDQDRFVLTVRLGIATNV
jgi:hypothetical protein